MTQTPQDKLPDEDVKRIRDRLDELSVDPYAVLGCPRIGIDEEANQHVRDLYEQFPDRFYVEIAREPEGTNERRALLLSEVLERFHGQYVPDLAKRPEGLGGVVGIAAPECSFRGKVVAGLSLLPDDMVDQAFQDMTSAQMLAYADSLERCAREAIQQANDPKDREAMERALSGETSSDEAAHHIREYWWINRACRWLRFWGNEGFSMWAWY